MTPGDLPQSLKDAVVAIEDERSHSHRGVDVRGVLRALWTNLMEGEAVEGSESALLAAVIRAPSRLNPRSNPGAAEWRPRLVLHRMAP